MLTPENLLANLPGMAYRAHRNPSWTLKFVSSGCETLTGYRSTELTGLGPVSYVDLIHPRDRDRVRGVVQQAVARRQPFEIEYRIHRRDGQERVVWEKGGEVEPRGFVEGFVMDVTERVMMDAQARQAEKLEALETLAEGVAHNFNNLLMGIQGCISVARYATAAGFARRAVSRRSLRRGGARGVLGAAASDLQRAASGRSSADGHQRRRSPQRRGAAARGG